MLTQSTYTLQKWIDLLGPDDRIVATANRSELEGAAPEAFGRRGPWRLFQLHELPGTGVAIPTAEGTEQHSEWQTELSTVEHRLARACRVSAHERVATLQKIVADDSLSPVARLALAAELRERQDYIAARLQLNAALSLAPNWEAAHYEDGKYWLACDDIVRASVAFQRAADLMPSFSTAFSNLGATLGELDQPEAAVAALHRALEHDPDSHTVLNNIGVVNRELGRLEESERALTRVTELAPDFVFGHYNLGHTRFLRGDYRGALCAYEEGQRRDPEKNRRQGCRLALVRFAAGDVAAAERDLWRFADQAPPEEREELLLEAYEIACAVQRAHPNLVGEQRFISRITAELNQN